MKDARREMAQLLPERHSCFKAQGKQGEGKERRGRRSLKACGVHRRAEDRTKSHLKGQRKHKKAVNGELNMINYYLIHLFSLLIVIHS